MDTHLFDELMESVQQMDEIRTGEREPSRETHVHGLQVKSVRLKAGLTQKQFAELIDVRIGTLRNWEQGRREPTGPARSLIRAIDQDSKHVISALHKGKKPSAK